MVLLFILVAFVVLFVAGSVATSGRDHLVDVPPDAADLELPVGPMQPEDVAQVRFGMAPRGYRMAEVDVVLARLAEELARRDARIGELEVALADEAERVLAATEQPTSGWAPPEPQGDTGVVAAEPGAVHAPVPDAPQPPDPPAAVEEPSPSVPAQPSGPTLTATDDAAFSPVDDDFPEVLPPDEAAPDAVEAIDDDGAQPPLGQPGEGAADDPPPGDAEDPRPGGGEDPAPGGAEDLPPNGAEDPQV